ncbi:hypothetical protein TWF281_004679 [Arthrobotrys megalospora]
MTRLLTRNPHMRFALLFPALSFLPWVVASDGFPPPDETTMVPEFTNFVTFPHASNVILSNMGAPMPKEHCPCNLDAITLETKPKHKPGDPFNGNSALLFAYARRLADIIAPGMNNGDSRFSLYLTPPFYPGIAVEEPDPLPLMNYQLWQYADGLLPPDSPVWDHDGGSYFNFYSEYLSYASVTPPLKHKPSARNNMLHLFSQLKAAAKAVDKAKADAIAAYKQTILLTTGSGGTLPPELQNLTVWLEENATYRICQDKLNDITKLYNHARMEYYGPGVQEVSDLLTTAASAKEYLKPIEGDLNMPCKSSPQSWAERLEEARTGKNSTEKSAGDLFYKPKYGLSDDYVQKVHLWSDLYRKGRQPESIFTFSLDDLANVEVDWAALGFPNLDRGRDEGIPGKDTILSLQTKTQTLTPQVEEIIISATDIQTFTINRGNWDKPDFKSSFPKLRADAPIRFTSPVVRPCRLLFAYGVQIDLRINDDDIKEFAYELDQTGTGKATLLGATRGLRVTDNNIVSTRTETGLDPGYPYLLAVLGEML